MKIKFIGATKGVTGSCTLLHHEESNTKMLVDCGGYVEGKNSQWVNAQDFPFNPKELKFVFLTHAHFDHCGLLPKLYKDGFVGSVYCTRATGELAKLILHDSQKHSLVYDESDVNKIRFFYIDDDSRFGWGKQVCLADSLRVSFIRSSHILGAAGVQINWGFTSSSVGKNIQFSGDIGSNSEKNTYLPLMKSNHFPFPDTDYLVVESTYGGRNREARYKSATERRLKLKEIVENIIFKNDGKLMIPAFAMHRAQEIFIDLFYVLENMIDVDQMARYLSTRIGYNKAEFRVVFDSPMMSNIANVYSSELFRRTKSEKNQYLQESLEEEIPKLQELIEKQYYKFSRFEGVIFTKSKYKTNTNREREVKQSSIIVASGGMCETGPILEYMDMLEGCEKNAIIFTGFLSSNSRGRQILNGSDDKFKAQVFDMAPFYSGHADEQDILEYVFDLGGREQNNSTYIFINHGTVEGKTALTESILTKNKVLDKSQRHVQGVYSLMGDETWFDLDKGAFEKVPGELAFAEVGGLINKIYSLEHKIDLLLSNLKIG